MDLGMVTLMSKTLFVRGYAGIALRFSTGASDCSIIIIDAERLEVLTSDNFLLVRYSALTEAKNLLRD